VIYIELGIIWVMKTIWTSGFIFLTLLALIAPTILVSNNPGVNATSQGNRTSGIFIKHKQKTSFKQGSGTAEDPYLISNAAELDAIRYHLDKHYKQVADIDLNDEPYSVADGWNPIGTDEDRFTGFYDGGHYKIINLFINRPQQNHVGLFGYISGATIKNLVIEDANITGERLIGTLAGKAVDSCQIEYVRVINTQLQLIERFCGGLIGNIHDASLYRCSSSGVINRGDLNDWNFIGGLIGTSTSDPNHSGSVINECYSTAAINSENHNSYGGLAAAAWYDTQITNCYARGDVVGTNDRAGGFVGDVSLGSQVKRIENSFSTGKVVGSAYGDVRGFVGYYPEEGVFINNFWDVETSGQSGSNYPTATGKTTEQMKMSQTFTDAGWDFQEVWSIDTFGIINDGYPYLRWQLIDLGCAVPANFTFNIIKKDTTAFSWSSSNAGSLWDIAWGNQGFNPTIEGTLIEFVDETFYGLSDLNPGQTYDIYLRSSCQNGQYRSLWHGPYSFTTVHLYNVLGGGVICSGYGDQAYPVILEGSNIDYTYQLYRNQLEFGAPVSGTGHQIVWPNMIAGEYSIYGFTNQSGDWMPGDSEIIESETPQVSFTPTFDTICIDALPIILRGGNPEGGTYTGDGVIQNVFFPDFAGLGTHQIAYFLTNDLGCTGADSSHVLVDECLYLTQLDIFGQIEVFPNPSTSDFIVKFQKKSAELNRIKVFNSQGQLVLEKEIKFWEKEPIINMKDQPPGFYSVRLIFKSGTVNKTILLQ
jgi:hypothetical protein